MVNAVFEYSALSERYGVDRKEGTQDLVIRPEFEAYPRINTAVGTPEELAQQVISVSDLQSAAIGMSEVA